MIAFQLNLMNNPQNNDLELSSTFVENIVQYIEEKQIKSSQKLSKPCQENKNVSTDTINNYNEEHNIQSDEIKTVYPSQHKNHENNNDKIKPELQKIQPRKDKQRLTFQEKKLQSLQRERQMQLLAKYQQLERLRYEYFSISKRALQKYFQKYCISIIKKTNELFDNKLNEVNERLKHIQKNVKTPSFDEQNNQKKMQKQVSNVEKLKFIENIERGRLSVSSIAIYLDIKESIVNAWIQNRKTIEAKALEELKVAQIMDQKVQTSQILI